MKILHTCELYSPSVGGIQEVVRQVSERLVARGHEVTVATTRLPGRTWTSLGGVRVEQFDISGNAVIGLRGEVERYQRFLLDGDHDVMMNYAAQQWTADLAFPLLGRLRARSVFVTCGFSALYDPAFRDYFARMPAVLDRYDGIVLHAERYRDADFVRAHTRTPATLITYGAALEEFAAEHDRSLRRRFGVPESVPFLITIGTHTALKGHGNVMRAFLRARTGPAVLAVIGNPWVPGCEKRCRRLARLGNALGLGRKRILMLDLPRADVVAALRSADLFVFASLIECSPIVLFETAAAGTPFITGPAGNAPEIAAWTGAGVVVAGSQRADGITRTDNAALTRAIERLVHDPAERERLGAAGRRAFLERLNWDRVTEQYEALYQQVLAAPPRHASGAAPEGHNVPAPGGPR
jgi:glycosyltransferase involved in cell wall biosynthesis